MRQQPRKFGLRDKLGYLFGDFGNDFFFILVSSFLMVYYTDIFGISAVTVGILFLVARLWDAVADVTWGRFLDTRKTGKQGKFKPWIFRMSFPLVISGVLMFVKIPGMSDGFYLAYAFVTYIVWGTLYSTVNISYGSMASVITSDSVERTTLSTYRAMGASLAAIIINVAGPLILLLIAILTASLIFMMCNMLLGAVNVYLFKDYFGNAAALSLVGFIQTGMVFIAIPLAKPLVAKYGKKETASVGMLVAVSYILFYTSCPI
jgi:GPH family glycoside/pentoside/hexuronide:cation symporter